MSLLIPLKCNSTTFEQMCIVSVYKPYQTTVCKLQLQIKTLGHAELPHGVDIGILLMFLPNVPQQCRCFAFRLTIFCLVETKDFQAIKVILIEPLFRHSKMTTEQAGVFL